MRHGCRCSPLSRTSRPLATVPRFSGGLRQIGGLWQQALRRLLQSRLATISGILLILLILAAIFAPLRRPVRLHLQDYAALTQPPSRAHWLGTDDLGRDILSRLIYGARISLAVGFVVQAVILLIGVPAGLIAAHFGGKIDTFIMRTVDVLYAMPSLLFVIVIMTFLRAALANPLAAFMEGLATLDGADRRADRRLHRRRAGQLDAGRPPRARPGRLPQGEGVRRGGARPRRQRPPDHAASTCCRT